MRLGVALLRCPAKPKGRLRVVLGNAPALVVQTPEVELCLSYTLLGGLAQPKKGFLIVNLNTQSAMIDKSHTGL